MIRNQAKAVVSAAPPAGTRRWAWFLLPAFVVMLLLAGFWMKKEIGRARLLRDYGAGSAQTNHGTSAPAPATGR